MQAAENKPVRGVGLGGSRRAARELHALERLLLKRGKRAALTDEAGEQISAAGVLFTPCTVAGSLLEAKADAAKKTTSGDVVLLAPACSSRDQIRNQKQRGEVICQALKSMGRVSPAAPSNIDGKTSTARQ